MHGIPKQYFGNEGTRLNYWISASVPEQVLTEIHSADKGCEWDTVVVSEVQIRGKELKNA
jgi:hypothetical protein